MTCELDGIEGAVSIFIITNSSGVTTIHERTGNRFAADTARINGYAIPALSPTKLAPGSVTINFEQKEDLPAITRRGQALQAVRHQLQIKDRTGRYTRFWDYKRWLLVHPNNVNEVNELTDCVEAELEKI
jgi:hypothetical protein